jgi:cytochrome c553
MLTIVEGAQAGNLNTYLIGWRNIGACATCHCPGVARAAAPILDGLPEAYLRGQLNTFKSGRRANDINQ